MFIAKELGSRLRERRKELGISITKASLDLHISPDHLRRIERGSRIPPIELLDQIADYLHVSLGSILSGEPELSELSDELEKVIVVLQEINTKMKRSSYTTNRTS